MTGRRTPLKVRDVMSEHVVTATPETPFKELASLLAREGVSALPIIGDNGRPMGIVTEADLLPKTAQRSASASLLESARHYRERLAKAAALTAGELMTSPIVMVQPDVPVAHAAQTIHARHVKRLPVVDEAGRLVGIVTRGDLLKVFLRPDEELHEEVTSLLTAAARRFGLHRLDVSVSEGVVTLAGEVEARSQVQAVERAVRRLDGVVNVDNRLEHRLDDREPFQVLIDWAGNSILRWHRLE
jgi:CBS domain-containing protein